jgi:hypothetical protein
MSMRYTQISDGVRARVDNYHLYVEVTDMQNGMLIQGGYSGRVYRMFYTHSLKDALMKNEWGISDINRCIENGTIVRKGRLIH